MQATLPYIDEWMSRLPMIETIKTHGKVTDVIGLIIESNGPSVELGEVCTIYDKNGKEICKTEVVGFKDGKVLSVSLGEVHNISPNSEIRATGKNFYIPVGEKLLGRIIDGLGRPIDGKGEIEADTYLSIYREPPNPLERERISEPLQTGIRTIDALLTVGKGQRMGIFAGSGVGKSVMMGMIARNTNADINVITLIGERGREAREVIEKDLGEEG